MEVFIFSSVNKLTLYQSVYGWLQPEVRICAVSDEERADAHVPPLSKFISDIDEKNKCIFLYFSTQTNLSEFIGFDCPVWGGSGVWGSEVLFSH